MSIPTAKVLAELEKAADEAVIKARNRRSTLASAVILPHLDGISVQLLDDILSQIHGKSGRFNKLSSGLGNFDPQQQLCPFIRKNRV